ncbi:MAG: hypothetical protein AAF694_17830 [Bacteroidota bacterium]
MKLRCVKDSIRLRLSKSDTQKLLAEGSIMETLEIGPQNVFTFGLSLDSKVMDLSVTFAQGTLLVSVPAELGKQWIDSQEVGIHNTLKEGKSGTSVLIEKDFPCKTRIEEDKSDRFGELMGTEGEVC